MSEVSHTQTQIRQILENRKGNIAKIQALWEEWNRIGAKASDISHKFQQLCNSCNLALRSGSNDSDATVRLKQLERCLQNASDNVASIGRLHAQAKRYLTPLQQRFDRDTINIAAAGVGRSGKSSTLKSILNQSQDDNRTIPSGSGPAITAGRSSIVCVLDEKEEKTMVSFHTEQSFLDKVVNPLLKTISYGMVQVLSLYEFEQLNIDALESQIGKIPPSSEMVIGPVCQHEHLSQLRRIRKNLSSFRAYLGAPDKVVNIAETAHYVSYQSEGQNVCYAVRDVKIYTRFPNNEVENLQLIDLPGLGTSSELERSCFLEGFDYRVDLALIIRRPEGLTQNFPSKPDMDVLEILEKTYGSDCLEDSVFLFQNDGGLNKVGADKSFAGVEEWNRGRPNPIPVLRGDALDMQFVQKELMSQILTHLTTSLPKVDERLLKESLKKLEELKAELSSLAKGIYDAIRSQSGSFRKSGTTNEVSKRVEEICDKILKGTNKLKNEYDIDIQSPKIEAFAQQIEDRVAVLKERVNNRYSRNNAELVDKVESHFRKVEDYTGYTGPEIHEIRQLITEELAQLENYHEELIVMLQDRIRDILTESFGAIFQGVSLAEIDDMFANGMFAELDATLKNILTLEAPFYDTLYPKLCTSVFKTQRLEEVVASVNDQVNLSTMQKLKKSAQPGEVLTILNEYAIQWIRECEDVLMSELPIQGILYAAVMRFEDRMGRNETIKEELNDFVEEYWGIIQGGQQSYEEDISNKLKSLKEALGDKVM